MNIDYDEDLKILTEAQNLQEGSLQKIGSFLVNDVKASAFVAKMIIGFLKSLYNGIKKSLTSEYNPVLSQQISDIIGERIQIKVFKDNKVQFYYMSGFLYISTFTVKYFTIRQLAALSVVRMNIEKVVGFNEMILFFPKLYSLHLLSSLVNKAEKTIGYEPANHKQILNALISIIEAEIIQRIFVELPIAFIQRKFLAKKITKIVKEKNLVKDFTSAIVKFKKLSQDIKISEIGTFLLKFDALFESKPSDKEILKNIIDDPEKLEIILGSFKKLF